MARRDSADVLRRARMMLGNAKLGLSDLEGTDPPRRIPGFHNVITFGRAVTFVLQNLRTIDEATFNEWYAPRQEAMRADALMRHFSNLRTSLLKEGRADTTTSLYIHDLNSADFASVLANPPPGATTFFIGDASGGAGWLVPVDGCEPQPFYIALPENIQVSVSLQVPDPPVEHLGQPILDSSAVGLSRLFLAYIERLLDDADAHFGKAS